MHQFLVDETQISADQMKTSADMLIDGIYRNHKACQIEKIGDVWKHWCLDNLDKCLWKDGKVWERIEDHGLELIGIGYNLFTILMNHDECATDEQRIKEIADVVEDLTSASVKIHGFDEPWDPKQLDHVTRQEFKKEVNEYKAQLKEAAEKKMQEMRDAVTPDISAWPMFRVPAIRMPNETEENGQFAEPHFERFNGWGN